MATKIQLRRDTSSSWTSVNPVLSQGEPGIETNTGMMKLGNGTTAWNCLPYLSTGSSSCVTWATLGNKNNNSGPCTVALGNEAGYICQAPYGSVAIGTYAGHANQSYCTVAIGTSTGAVSQGEYATAVGPYAAGNTQSTGSTAIGYSAGFTQQGSYSVAIGYEAARGYYSFAEYVSNCSTTLVVNSTGCISAGMRVLGTGFNGSQRVCSIIDGTTLTLTSPPNTTPVGDLQFVSNQCSSAIAIGQYAGANNQRQNAVAIGICAGANCQGCRGIAIGICAGGNQQLADGIAIGTNAGWNAQCNDSVAIGTCAGYCHQGEEAIAIGIHAGYTNQQRNAIAMGRYAGSSTQGCSSIAIGHYAAQNCQGRNSVAIGFNAGVYHQGNSAVAIGHYAAYGGQVDNSIVINAACCQVNPSMSGLYINPVRDCGSLTSNTVYYNTSTKEMTYGPSGSGGIIIPSPVQTAVGVPNVTITGTAGTGPCHASITICVQSHAPVISTGVVITAGACVNAPVVGGAQHVGCQSIAVNIPGTDAPFTAYAYLQTPFTTVFSPPVSGTSGVCFVKGTMIALSDGTYKAIEDINYNDLLLVWDFDLGRYAEAKPVWIKAVETETSYNLLTFSDGSTLRTSGNHHIFNKEAQRFTHTLRSDTPLGTTTVNEYGNEVTLVSTEVIPETVETYNVFTEYHLNMFADGILTSNRFNNTYPIVDMKFVKTDRALRPISEFAGIDRRWVDGLRLREQTSEHSADYIRWYMQRLEYYDVQAVTMA